MELDLVDAVAEAIVRAQLRRVGVGLESPVDRLLGAGQRSEVVHEVMGPRSALAFERLAQRRVGFEEVVVDERRRLVHEALRSLRPSTRMLISSGMSPTTALTPMWYPG